MELINQKSHLIEHKTDRSFQWYFFRMFAAVIGVLLILFIEYFTEIQLSTTVEIIVMLIVVILPFWNVLDWHKVQCDTHHQVFNYNSILSGKVSIPFDELLKIKVWVDGEIDNALSDSAPLTTTIDRVELVGKQGEHIVVEDTNKFNVVINNYLAHVPKEFLCESH